MVLAGKTVKTSAVAPLPFSEKNIIVPSILFLFSFFYKHMYGFPLLFAKKYKLFICTEANKPYLYNTEINYMSSEVIIDVRKTTTGKLRSIENPET